MSEFNDALAVFLSAINEGQAVTASNMHALMHDYYAPITTEEGPKNIRVIATVGGHRSVYCFVRKADGAILKAAGWKSPAKGERGNIFVPDSFSHAKAAAYGGWLYH